MATPTSVVSFRSVKRYRVNGHVDDDFSAVRRGFNTVIEGIIGTSYDRR
jgi:hypothetical protein